MVENNKNAYINVNAVKCIANIIATFNFEKVADIMEYLDWHYSDKNSNPYIPSADILRDNAFDSLVYVYTMYHNSEHETTGEPYYLSGGGFEASYWYDNSEGIDDSFRDMFSLKFIVEEYES